ncbi:MAG TPA: choice-of-anchor P family protein, partial [Acidimicrobiales bacterium]|nr:choice-of-anchor P family protein [Acidimicrobiales bacterium]
MRTRMQKLRVALLAASTLGASVLFYAANPAHADVDAVAGSAFGASITSSLLGTVLAPSPPGVAGSATEPADGFGPINAQNCPIPVSTTICVQVPGVLSLGALNAGTQGGGVAGENHLGFATSTASVANIAVGSVGAGLFAQAISSTCTADGNGARGSTTVLGGVLGTNPILQSPAAGTMLEIPGVLEVVLNEQLPIPPATTINSPGSAGIIVNGARITLLPAVAGLPVLEIILAQSVCAAAGPNVNQPVVSSTTLPPTSSSTTSSSVPTSSSTTSSSVPTSSSTTSSSVPTSSSTTSSTLPPTSSTTTSTTQPGTTPTTGGNVSNINICNAGSGGNGGAGAGIGGNAVAGGGTGIGIGNTTGGTATGGAAAGVGGTAGNGGDACNGLGGFINNGAIGSFNGLTPAGLGNVNICNAGNGGNGGPGLGVGGTGASTGGTNVGVGSSTGGTATGGAGGGVGGTAGDGGNACNVTIAAATTIPGGGTTTIPASGSGSGSG